MRVVAGTARGRLLRAPEGRATRPTSDRVRESMFDILASRGCFEGPGGDDGAGVRVVDLFAGSGALGIEALSRGARSAVFVDSDAAAVAAIGENLRSLGWSGPSARVVRADVQRWASGPGAPDVAGADVVLADPPYAFDGWGDLLAALVGSGFCGLAVLKTGMPVEVGPGWEVVKARRYGTTVVHLVRPALLAGVRVDPKGGV